MRRIPFSQLVLTAPASPPASRLAMKASTRNSTKFTTVIAAALSNFDSVKAND